MREKDRERESIAEGLRAALRELGEVFSELVQTAEAKSFLRCPYMNIRRECTAGFECINQVWTPKRERAICSGQHKINFSCGRDHAALARGAEPPTSELHRPE